MADAAGAAAEAEIAESSKSKEQKKLEKAARRADKIADKVESGEAPLVRPPPVQREPRPQQQQKQSQQQTQESRPKQAAPAKVAPTGGAIPAAKVVAPPTVAGLAHIRSSLESLPSGLTPAFSSYAASLIDGSLHGVNARATALVHAVQADVQAFQRPADKAQAVLAWALDPHLVQQFDLISTVRPFVPALLNVLRWVRSCVSRLDPALADEDAVTALSADLQAYIDSRINTAARIAAHVQVVPTARPSGDAVPATGPVMVHGADTILVHGGSTAIRTLLLAVQAQLAQHSAAPLNVVIVDSKPRLSGKSMVPALMRAGVNVTYTTSAGVWGLLSGTGAQRIVLALLGAVSVMQDGSVLGEAGQESVALAAHEFGVRVLCVSEGYKVGGRVLMDGLSDINEVRPVPETLWSKQLTQPWSPAAQAGAVARETEVATAVTAAKASKKGGGEVLVAPQVWAEGGSAAAGAGAPSAQALRETKALKVLSLSYGLTAALLVSGALTEAGVVPCALMPLLVSEYGRLEEAGRDAEEGSQ